MTLFRVILNRVSAIFLKIETYNMPTPIKLTFKENFLRQAMREKLNQNDIN
jgi:hypothetical protein